MFYKAALTLLFYCIWGTASAVEPTAACSESSSESLRIPGPPYVISDEGMPVMQFAVFNRTTLISQELLRKTIHAVKKQVKRDFSPYYGIRLRFDCFQNIDDVNWTYYVPLIIENQLLTDPGLGTTSFHDIQPDPTSNLVTGDPIGIWINNPPNLPPATPYIIIPLGPNTDYGVYTAYTQKLPYLPATFEDIFSLAVSHEVLETLHNYSLAQYTNTFSNAFGEPCEPTFDFYVQEVCDPVEFSHGYKMEGVAVANFVLPSYWVPTLHNAPFDFLHKVLAPLIPFAGEQVYYEFSPCTCGAEGFALLSPPDDPYSPQVVDLVSLCQCVGPRVGPSTSLEAANDQTPKLKAGPRVFSWLQSSKS